MFFVFLHKASEARAWAGMRTLLVSCTIMAAAASSVCTDAHAWAKKLSYSASDSSPDGEAPRTYAESRAEDAGATGALLFGLMTAFSAFYLAII